MSPPRVKPNFRAATCIAAAAGATTVASGQSDRALQVSPVPEMIVPTRYAPIVLVDGQARLAGEWRDYDAPDAATREGTRGCERLWDALQVHPCSGEPIGGGECGVPDRSRWYFGAQYLNPLAASEMSMDPGYEGSFATRAGWMWWWGATAVCYVGILTAEDSFRPACDEPPGAAGWVFEFPALKSGMWFTSVDLGTGGTDGWTMPQDGAGANLHFLADRIENGDFCVVDSFGAHLALWGTADAGGIPGRPGSSTGWSQDVDAFICGAPGDAWCYFTDLGVCPIRLTHAITFWGVPGDPLPCFVDCNNDRVLDTRDLFCFLNLYAAGDAAADCNGDTAINSLDVMCFLDLFRYPPCP